MLWVNATSREAIIASFLELASLLELPERQEADQNKIVASVKRWLTTHERWLLIFDNADDLALAEEFLPAGRNGTLLVTTRNQSAGTLAESLDIQTMEREEGILLVLRRAKLLGLDKGLTEAKPEERALAQKIVEAMDSLPLALDQAAAYIEETGCSPADFLDRYRRQRAEILRRRGGTGNEHPLPVATTWALSFTQVEQMNPAAADLLRVCAFLAPDAIPEEMIAAGAEELGPELAPLAEDSSRLDEIIAALNRFSLLRRDREKHMLSLHRLVQDAQLMQMEEGAHKQWAERAVRAVNQAFPSPEFANWPTCERMLPHALRCASVIETEGFTFTEAARLLNETAGYLQERGQYPEAEPLYQRALATREQTLGQSHPDTATSLNNLAVLYYHQGKYEQVEPLYRRAIAADEKTYGTDHPEVATDLNNLAELYRSQGKYEQAEPLYQRALAIREQALGQSHPDTATSLNNLAALYRNQGKYEQTEPLYQRALAIREQTLGQNHPDTAQSFNDLALLYKSQGKYEQAEPLYQRALAVYEKVLGVDHPYTKIVRANYEGFLAEARKRTESK